MTDPINAALDRLQEYAAAHPEHDTDELVARARAELAEPADAPTTVAEGPSDEEIMELMPQQMREDLAAAARAIAEQAGTDSRRAMGAMRIILNRHAVDLALAVLARWGQPPAPVPVPVGERLPGPEDCVPHPRTKLGSWCWGFERYKVSLARPARWRLMHMEAIELEASHWLEAHALPLPAPQGGEVEP